MVIWLKTAEKEKKGNTRFEYTFFLIIKKTMW